MTTTGAVALIALVIGVIGGMQYEKHKIPAVAFGGPNQMMRGNGQYGGRAGGMMRGGGAVAGEVISKDDKSITIKTSDGGSKIIFFSGTTTFSKSAQGTIADVAVGSQLFVGGTTNTDGSVTATTIQLRPAMPAPTTLKQ